MTKKHIPAAGKASGLHGPALCGRWATYATGDHYIIRRNADDAYIDGQSAHWCQTCLRTRLAAIGGSNRALERGLAAIRRGAR